MAKAAYDAIAARLGATWASTDGNVLPVLNVNKDGQSPADGGPFLALEFPVTNEKQFTLGAPGSNFWKQECVFIVVINEQRGIGNARARGWADELDALYRGQQFSDVRCFEASGPVINDANDLGNYFQLRIAIRYEFFVTG